MSTCVCQELPWRISSLNQGFAYVVRRVSVQIFFLLLKMSPFFELHDEVICAWRRRGDRNAYFCRWYFGLSWQKSTDHCCNFVEVVLPGFRFELAVTYFAFVLIGASGVFVPTWERWWWKPRFLMIFHSAAGPKKPKGELGKNVKGFLPSTFLRRRCAFSQTNFEYTIVLIFDIFVSRYRHCSYSIYLFYQWTWESNRSSEWFLVLHLAWSWRGLGQVRTSQASRGCLLQHRESLMRSSVNLNHLHNDKVPALDCGYR